MKVTVRFYDSGDRLLEAREADVSGPDLLIHVSPVPDGTVRATASWPQNASGGTPVTVPAGTAIRWD